MVFKNKNMTGFSKKIDRSSIKADNQKNNLLRKKLIAKAFEHHSKGDFKVAEKKKPKRELIIENLKISVRELTNEDIKNRNLPNQTKGLIITKIENDSPLINSIEVNSIILEAQKKKIKTADDLNLVVKQVLKSNQKTILLVIYNSQNQRRYIGIKLD